MGVIAGHGHDVGGQAVPGVHRQIPERGQALELIRLEHALGFESGTHLGPVAPGLLHAIEPAVDGFHAAIRLGLGTGHETLGQAEIAFADVHQFVEYITPGRRRHRRNRLPPLRQTIGQGVLRGFRRFHAALRQIGPGFPVVLLRIHPAFGPVVRVAHVAPPWFVIEKSFLCVATKYVKCNAQNPE